MVPLHRDFFREIFRHLFGDFSSKSFYSNKKAWATTRRICKEWKIVSDEVLFFHLRSFLFPLLYRSVLDSNLEAIRFFLDRGLDPSQEEQLLIRYSALNGNLKVVEMLMKHPKVDPTVNENEPIRNAAFNLPLAQMLLEDVRVDPSAMNNHMLLNAVQNGETKMVRLLLNDKRVDPSVNDNEPIRWASERGFHEIVQILMKDPRVDPSAKNDEAIRSASNFGFYKVVRILLRDPRVNPTAKLNDALNSALRNHHQIVTKLLLEVPAVSSFDRVKA